MGKLLTFGAGMIVGGIIVTTVLCCVMINNSKFGGKEKIKESPEPPPIETE